MLFVHESREHAIKRLLKERKELYVVDIDLVDNKTGKSEKQWVIYGDLGSAQNYLALIKNHYVTLDVSGLYNLTVLDNGDGDANYLRFRYIDNAGNDISQMFIITKVEGAT